MGSLSAVGLVYETGVGRARPTWYELKVAYTKMVRAECKHDREACIVLGINHSTLWRILGKRPKEVDNGRGKEQET